MSTDVIMPQMGESIFEGTITKWLKQPGDSVEKDEPLFEISTDKVDAEIPSPIAGVLREIKFPEGATVQVNTVVAVMSDGAGTSEANTARVEKQKAGATPGATAKVKGGDPAATPAADEPRAEPLATRLSGQAGQAADAGRTEIVMPQMGESIFEGTITKWLKKIGDVVRVDEPLFEISTDKVDAEIPSSVAGVLLEIRAGEGETVQVQTVVAVVGSEAAQGESKPAAVANATGSAAVVQTAAKAAVLSATAQAAPVHTGRIRSSPLVRRIAKERNIDLARVSGSGANGRINKDDILRYTSQPPSHKPQVERATLPVQPKAEPAQPRALADEIVPMTKMRAIIAQRMSESKRTVPHAHSVYKVDMTRVVRLRDRERAAFEQRHGFKLTYMPFIAVAAIEALRRFPVVNASLVDGSIHYHGNIHLGIAVALEWGLIVPVVRASETQSFAGLARAINDLAGRARAKKLMPDEVGGSTFTLTNPGVFGGEWGLPIINQPESAILAIGGLRKEPVVLTDAEGNDTIAIRSVQYFCLGFDHRLIDGADSGKFMTEFKNVLESWNRGIE